jgi:hypothetical protein
VTRLRLDVVSLMMGAAGPALVSCGSGDSPAVAPMNDTPSSSSSTPGEQSTPSAGGTEREEDMRIEITIGDQRFQATLDDSAATRDLVDQLPVTLEVSDHGSVEKTGRLPAPLSLDGQPAGADPDVGDVGYYSSGSDLVLYYGDQSYYDGIVVLGQMESGAAERIAELDGSITATVSALDE